MNQFQLDIEGFIGDYGNSKSFVKNFLAYAGKNPVTVNVDSRGGDVAHAISIYNLFASHGEVTVHLVGFNASAATVLTLSAKKILMDSNGFYLIHKALNWVDAWGNMNPEDIDALIETLTKSKKELETVTLVLAKMYATKTGKTTTEILNLMKEETWLTAEEALAWGFIDEISDPLVAEDLLANVQKVAMLNYSELPIPSNRSSLPVPPVPANVSVEPRIINSLKKFINSKFIMKQFSLLNNLLTVPSLESSEEGIYLNEAQAEQINSALALHETLVAEHATALNTLAGEAQQIATQRDEAITACNQAIVNTTSATETITGITASLDQIDPSIAQAESIDDKITAIRNFMAAKPSVTPVGVVTSIDPAAVAESDNIKLLNSLPHMQED